MKNKMNKSAMSRKVKEMLASHNIGDIIYEGHELLLDFLSHNPDWERKKGAGVMRFRIGDDGHRGKCFWIDRIDGTSTDISYTKARDVAWFKNVNDDGMKDVRMACRKAVEDIIEAMRIKWSLMNFVCPISGNLVKSGEKFDIDHYDMDFSDVVRTWMESKSEEERKTIWESINETEDGETTTFFTNEEIALDFRAWHDGHTHLRAVSRDGNRKKHGSMRNVHDIFLGR